MDEHNIGDWLRAGAVAVRIGGSSATRSLDSIEAAARRVRAALSSAGA